MRLFLPRSVALQRARTRCVQIHFVTYMIFAAPVIPQTMDCLCTHRPGMAHTPPFGTRLCCHAFCDTMRHRTVVPHARDHFSATHMARTHENVPEISQHLPPTRAGTERDVSWGIVDTCRTGDVRASPSLDSRGCCVVNGDFNAAPRLFTDIVGALAEASSAAARRRAAKVFEMSTQREGRTSKSSPRAIGSGSL